MKIQLVSALSLALGCATASALTPPTPGNQATRPTTDSVAAIVRQKCNVDSAEAGNVQKDIDIAQSCVNGYVSALKAAAAIDDKLAGLSPGTAAGIRERCTVTEDASDLSKVSKLSNDLTTCVIPETDTAIAAQNAAKKRRSTKETLEESLSPTVTERGNLPVEFRYNKPEETPAGGGGTPPPGEGPSPVDSNPPIGAASAGQQVMGSVFSTPSACIRDPSDSADGSKLTNPALVGVRRELLAPKEASDVYGRRLGKRYIVYQVRVSDYSKDYQYIVHDISLYLGHIFYQRCQARNDAATAAAKAQPCDLDALINPKLPMSRFLASSRDLEVLRGVPEKGQDYDPRNLTLHILTGVGSVSGGISGLTPFSDVMGSAVSLFSGAFIQAFTGIYPDHTGTQLNRLSDQAFTSNKVVDKLHTSVFTIFIPQSMLLDEAEQKTFWSHPRELLDKYSLDRVNVCVDGSLVTEVSGTPNPAFSPTSTNVGPGTTVTISDSASDAVIYYTDVDGTTPTSSSTKYPGSITLPDLKTPNTTMNIQAIAISPGKQQSSIVSQTYVISRMPTASVSADGSTVTLTGAVVGETIYYTINGDAPTSTVSNTNIPCKPSSATTKATCSNISVTGTTSFTVKAVEYDTAAPPSPGPVGTFSYTPPKTAATAK
jgi:hypothetical protein